MMTFFPMLLLALTMAAAGWLAAMAGRRWDARRNFEAGRLAGMIQAEQMLRTEMLREKALED